MPNSAGGRLIARCGKDYLRRTIGAAGFVVALLLYAPIRESDSGAYGMEPLTVIFLAETTILIVLLLRSWLWVRYPLFTAMLVADIVKYSLWSFYDPGLYVLVDGPVLALRMLAGLEAVWRASEFVESRLVVFGMYGALTMIGLSIGMSAPVRLTEISDYNAARVAMHCAAGLALVLFAFWWWLKNWDTTRMDISHLVLLGSLCLAYGIADAITLAEMDIDRWIWKVAAFRGVRIGIYYGWIRLHVPLKCSRISSSSLAMRSLMSLSR